MTDASAVPVADPWFGVPPLGWEVQRLRRITNFVNGAAFKPGEWTDSGTPIVRIENLNGSQNFNFARRHLPQKYLVSQGDILFGWSGNRGTSFGPFIWDVPGPFYLNQHIFRVTGFSCDKKWLYWALKAVTADIEARAHGIIGMVHVTRPELDRTLVPVPPLDVQRAIVDLLDRKTAAIDTLVAKKEHLLTLLQEELQARIARAVTQGLDSTTALKDSGVRWVGRIPTHWTMKKLRHVAQRVDVGIAEAATHAYSDQGVPLLRSTNVTKGTFAAGDLLFIEPWFAERNKAKYLRAGDILSVRTGDAGRSVVVPPDLDRSQCFTLLMTTLKSQYVPEFYCAFINSRVGRTYFDLESWGTAQKNISVPILAGMPVPDPPREEQLAISQYVTELERRASLLKCCIEVHLAKLSEYRQALISAAVTGQLDLPAQTEAA